MEITPAGDAVLAAYDLRAEQQRHEPSTITRNSMLGERHDPREAIRVLRIVATGEEIRVGDGIADPFGTLVTYLGPTMSRISGDSIWLPGFIARVLYPGDVPWVFLPTDLGAAYEDAPGRPA
ncbi:hypothetical protein [Streptomyces anthocyanicus]|uniref:hypothetical protein n=1 Tax=Streptomyces anthocyanicus TaxID=68174 RepID=UPI00381F7986